MALKGFKVPKQGSSGGGGIGSAIGTILAGGLAAVASGGISLAALPAIAGAASLGGQVGGAVGGTISKPEDKQDFSTPQQTTMEKRQMDIESSPLMQLANAHKLSDELPEDLKAQVRAPLELAMQRVAQQGSKQYGA